MNVTQLQQGIEAKFAIGSAKECRLLFWYDPEQSFKEALATIAVPGVTVLNMSELSIFETKKRIELDEPEGRFLLYFPYAEPDLIKTGFLIFAYIVNSFTPMPVPCCSMNWGFRRCR